MLYWYLRTYNSDNNRVITKVSMIPINKIFALNIMIMKFVLIIEFLKIMLQHS